MQHYNYPKNTETETYLSYEASLQEIFDLAIKKWPGIEIGEINISPEHIQISGCFCHPDGSDFQDFFKIYPSDSYIERVTRPEYKEASK